MADANVMQDRNFLEIFYLFTCEKLNLVLQTLQKGLNEQNTLKCIEDK